MSTLETFRKETRTWLAENCPQSMRIPAGEDEMVVGGRNATFKNPDSKLWLERMGERGWTCPTWPKAYGGGGLSDQENQVLQEELARINAREALSNRGGTDMLGPVLLEFGNEAQKKEHLSRIARGEVRWCQGYSEPGAGSDLAGLKTQAVLEGDDYVINGSKIWTSSANLADWIFCLVRTDPKAPKHKGISFILFDMATAGVDVHPIKLISGASPFCQTFFTDVRVPRRNLIGTVNEGWTIAKRLLQYERTMISNLGHGGVAADSRFSMENQAKKYLGEFNGRIADPVIRDEISRHKMNGEIFAMTSRRSAEEAQSTQGPSATSSMFKYYGTEHNKRRYEIMMKIMGAGGLGWGDAGFEPHELSTTREWLRSRANSIEGGTSEVQLNVIAKRVLGLPD